MCQFYYLGGKTILGEGCALILYVNKKESEVSSINYVMSFGMAFLFFASFHGKVERLISFSRLRKNAINDLLAY
jgi:hypothetical protein